MPVGSGSASVFLPSTSRILAGILNSRNLVLIIIIIESCIDSSQAKQEAILMSLARENNTFLS